MVTLLDSNLSLINSTLPEGCWKENGELDEKKFEKEMGRRFNYASGLSILCNWAENKKDYNCTPIKKVQDQDKFTPDLNDQYFKNLDRMLYIIKTKFGKFEKPTVIFKCFHKYRDHNPWFMLFPNGWADKKARELREKYLDKVIQTCEPHKDDINLYYEDCNESPLKYIHTVIQIFDYLRQRISLKRIIPGVQKVEKKDDREFKNTQAYRKFRIHYEDTNQIRLIQTNCRFTVHQFIKNDVAPILQHEENIPAKGKYFGWIISKDGDVWRRKKDGKVFRERPDEGLTKKHFKILFKNKKAMTKMLDNCFIEAFSYQNLDSAKWIAETYKMVFGKEINKNVGKFYERTFDNGTTEQPPEPKPDRKPEFSEKFLEENLKNIQKDIKEIKIKINTIWDYLINRKKKE